jgi:hypothetical protein
VNDYVQKNVPLTCYNANVTSGRLFYFEKGGVVALRGEERGM